MTRSRVALIIVAAVAVPSHAASAKVTAEPTSVVLSVTRPWGPFAGNSATGKMGEAWLRDVPQAVLPSTSLLGSDQGRRVRVRLRETQDVAFAPPPGWRGAAVELVDLPRPGSYSGEVPIGTSGALKVKVLVQDFILWPVLAVLLGAMIGGLGTRSYAWRRRRKLLLGSLKEALERYAAERAAAPTLGGAYDLEWPRPEALPEKASSDDASAPVIDAARQTEVVWCAALRAKGDEALDALTPHVAQISAELERWRELDFELRRLSTVADRLEAHDLLPYVDAQQLAEEMGNPPVSEEQRGAWVLRIRQQTNVMAAFYATWAVWGVLDGKQWECHRNLDPQEIYKSSPREANRTESDTVKLLRSLGRARDELLVVEASSGTLVEERGARALALPLLPSSAAAVSALTVALTRLGSNRDGERRTSVELTAAARRWDWLLQAAVAVVSVVAYVLTVYGSHKYGQASDYLSALAVGLLGQMGSFSIDWNRFRASKDVVAAQPSLTATT